MSHWGWVALAYGVTYGSLAAFAASIAIRIRKTRTTLGENQ